MRQTAQRMRRRPAAALAGALLAGMAGAAAGETLDATAFGLKADGAADDGPAVRRMLEAAGRLEGPLRIVFPRGRTIRITSAPRRYVFPLENVSDVTLDGNGCTLLLGPRLRLLRLVGSRRVTVRGLKVDFAPLPFADGTVVAVGAKEGYLDVRLAPAMPSPVGGPTHADGEQAYFSMLWYAGPYGRLGRHYWTKRIDPGPEKGTVRAWCDERFRRFDDIAPGTWRISMPVPGIAHRYGPGACVGIFDCDTVTFEDVELYTAPWFGFHVVRCAGEVTFRRVHIRPRPGTGRLMSTWRDGFHVKGNTATLLWEDCILTGMNDDAFNISTHCSRVRELLPPRDLLVAQVFPLNPMPWLPGERLVAADFEKRTLLGAARVLKATPVGPTRSIRGKPAAGPVRLELAGPIAGLKVGAMVWQPASANPHTTLRRCRIANSCRFQSPVTLERCDVTAFLWFYGERVEGPFPSGVTVRDCTLRRGRGNRRMAVSFLGRAPGAAGPSAVRDVTFEGNRVWGEAVFQGVDNLRLRGNRWLEPGAGARLERCRGVRRDDTPLPRPPASARPPSPARGEDSSLVRPPPGR